MRVRVRVRVGARVGVVKTKDSRGKQLSIRVEAFFFKQGEEVTTALLENQHRLLLQGPSGTMHR